MTTASQAISCESSTAMGCDWTVHVILLSDVFHYLSADICYFPTNGSHIIFLFLVERTALCSAVASSL
jgi:hypothetical protein